MLNSLLSALHWHRFCSPFRLEAELALDNLDEVFAVYPLVAFFEQEDLLVRTSEQNLVQDVFVRAKTGTSAVKQVQVAA